jgi:hypothetical protein
MKQKGEQIFGVVLLLVGMFITGFTQIRINTFSLSTVYVTPSPDYPRWMPLEYKHWMEPFGLIRCQEAGLMVLAAGVVLWVRPYIFSHEQLKHDSEKDRLRG